MLSIHSRVASFTGALLLLLFTGDALAKKCFYVSSYHQGYAWSDGVERGLRSALAGHCELRQFDMDTKRNKSEEFKQQAALQAKAEIESWQPDVVITSDDNAAKYLIKPYFKDAATPFVFSGINWNVDAYGFPYSNVTGIVEVAPVSALFDRVSKIQGKPETAFYLGADTLTEKKNLARFVKAAEKKGVELEFRLVKSMSEWVEAYREAQASDFLIIGSNSGIDDWDDATARQATLQDSRRLSLTNHAWMMPFTVLGLTKVPEEHGEWAGAAAVHILQGVRPSEIAITSNRKWDIWLNEAILKTTGIKLPKQLRFKAKKVAP